MNIKNKLLEYINSNLENDYACYSMDISSAMDMELESDTSFLEEIPKFRKASINLDSFIDSNKTDNKFQELLFKYIDERELKDSDVYNKVHIDRRLFSKIRSDSDYHPSKDTIILLGLSLELNEEEIIKLLESASYSLPKNNVYDLIIRFCFVEGVYKIDDVNELLDLYGCKLFSY